jgi:hypothetical protein
MTKITCVLFAASLTQAASFDITRYGAIGNGTTPASAAINKAHVTAEHAAGVPVVRLEDVNGFRTHNTPWTVDIKLGRIDEKQF